MKVKRLNKVANKNLVVMDNDLIAQACGKLSAMELKILRYLISKVDSTKENFKGEYEIDLQELKSVLEISNEDNFYRDLKKCLKTLGVTPIYIKDKLENRTLVEFHTVWLTSIEYCSYADNKKLKYCKISFHPRLAPYLVGLSNKFTKYNFSHLVKLKKKESILLYELLKMYEGVMKFKGEYVATISLADMRDKLNLEDRYDRYSEFKRIILIPCIGDILSKTDLRFEYRELRKGRVITYIEFTFDYEVDKLI